MDGAPLRSGLQSPGESLESHGLHLRVHAINIYVRDQDRSLHFYVDQLGFDLAFDAVLQTGERWIAVTPPDGSAMLMLVAPKPDSSEYKLIGRPTGVVFVTEDVIAKYGEWCRRGVRFQYVPRLRRVKYTRRTERNHDEGIGESQNSTWGGVFTHFRDVDGNLFALIGFDEVNREIEAQRVALAERIKAERLAAHELQIAKQVQARLFPQVLPPLTTLEYDGICLQARQVGGDYFDFLNLEGQRLGLVVGDIAGKGIAAALLMANLQANLRIQCAVFHHGLRHLLRSVNQVFYSNTNESAYATLFFAQYDDDSRRLSYVNCGHLPALLLRGDDTMERLDATGTVLGLFGEWDCLVAEQTLFPGDVLAVYTDGVTESFDDRDEQFGEERLVDALRQHRQLSSREMVNAVVDEVLRFSSQEQQDDITLIVARCR